MITTEATIATSLDGALHMFSLLEIHVRACEAFRVESTPAHPGVLVPTERSILHGMIQVQEVRLAISTADQTIAERMSVKVASLVEDLRIGNTIKPWTSSFDDAEQLFLSITSGA